jgi:hypothetical protein
MAARRPAAVRASHAATAAAVIARINGIPVQGMFRRALIVAEPSAAARRIRTVMAASPRRPSSSNPLAAPGPKRRAASVIRPRRIGVVAVPSA